MTGCNADERVGVPDISNLLFSRDWGKNIQVTINKLLDSDKADPVIIIYKDSAVTPADDRIILITPIIKEGTEEIGIDPIISSYKVSVTNPEKQFKSSSDHFQADRVNEIEKLWLICSDLVISANKGTQQDANANFLEEHTKYYIFSTLRLKDGTTFFSGHMAGMIQKPAQGINSQQLVVACDKIISAILPPD